MSQVAKTPEERDQALLELNRIEYALGKQIPLGDNHLRILSFYGEVELDEELGRKAVQAVRLVLLAEANRLHQIACDKRRKPTSLAGLHPSKMPADAEKRPNETTAAFYERVSVKGESS